MADEPPILLLEKLSIRWKLHLIHKKTTNEIVNEVIRVSKQLREVFEMEELLYQICPVVIMWSLHVALDLDILEVRRKLKKCVRVNDGWIGIVSGYLEPWLDICESKSFLFKKMIR
jgi:hypothetical protein